MPNASTVSMPHGLAVLNEKTLAGGRVFDAALTRT